jgi:flagellar protein FliO/FliZ
MLDRRRSPRSLISRPRGTALRAALALGLVLAAGVVPGPHARGQAPATPRRPVARAEDASASVSRSAHPQASSSGAWWVGTAGMALALAACGWASLAARRFLPGRPAGASSVRVVSRTSLSPRHSVYLLDVGGRVLIVGTGPQGAPSLLGEMASEEGNDSPSGRSVELAGRRLDVRTGESP